MSSSSSNQAGPSQPAQHSVYQHLYRLHEDNDFHSKEQSLNALPEGMRQQIFYGVWKQAGEPSEPDYGKVHVFDDLPRLQKAVHQVAVKQFEQLNPIYRNQIAWKIWDRADRPQGDNWGEMHAGDDIPVLLKIMHDSLGDLTPELQKILDDWVSAGEANEKRSRARDEIIKFLKNPAENKIQLLFLDLKSLPSIFDKEPFISRLEILDVSISRLESIPEGIFHLRNLKSLIFQANNISSIPQGISRLRNLEKLVMGANQLRSIPLEVFQLTKLTKLDLGNNLIESVPPEIFQLTNLKELQLYGSQFRSVPVEIGQLGNLTTLNLRNNTRFQGIPNEVLNLPHGCDVDIQMTGLSAHVCANLQEFLNAPGYNGPRISYSMAHMEQHYDGQLKPLNTLITELYVILKIKPKALAQLQQLDEEQKATIQSWISRLSDTADYKRQGEFQKAFVAKIVGYLELAEEDPQFREVFLNIIYDATQTCGDRVALSILNIGVAAKLYQIKQIPDLAQFLTRTVWPLQMLEEIARKKTETLNFFDEIEVYLGYPIMLKNRLNLDIAVDEMLYFRCSALTQNDLNLSAQYVEEQQNDKEALCRFLASHPNWIKALQEHYPEKCGEIAEQDFAELEAAGEDQGKIAQLEKNRQGRWEALTAWVLVSNSS